METIKDLYISAAQTPTAIRPFPIPGDGGFHRTLTGSAPMTAIGVVAVAALPAAPPERRPLRSRRLACARDRPPVPVADLADCPPSDTRWRRFCLQRSQLPSGGNGAGTPLCTGVPGGVFPWGARYSWPVTHIQGLASFALGENAPKGCDQPIKFDRLAVELVAPRDERPFALAGERMSGESDNGDVAGLRIAP